MVSPIKNYIKTFVDSSKSWKCTLLYAWPSIIGTLNDKVHIEKIDDDSITLTVFHSCWIQELYLLSPLLLKRINEKLDLPRIKHIRFKQAGNKKKREAKKTPIKQTNPAKIYLTQKDELALKKINDPILRDVLKAFRIRCYRE